MYLQTPIADGSRIVIVTRFSTEEQRRQSTADQFEYGREFLVKHKVKSASPKHISDEGISGEVRDRPGIRQLLEDIRSRRIDLIICEDSSRLYRGIDLCMRIFGPAVDAGIRIICINDGVDTANDDWENRLQEAQRHHGQDNFYTRHRIKRAHDGLWRMGAAIGLLRSGYLRHRQDAANPKSPKFDSKDPQWIETIREGYWMAASDICPNVVARYFTEARLPKTANAQSTTWTAANVISLIRCSKYRGVEVYREEISKKNFETGKWKPTPNPKPENVLTREMPHLRIVEDWLWYLANEAIDNRIRGKDRPSGAEHTLHGIPRDSRSPLSNLFVCGICGGKMYMTGRNEGGYRCAAATRGDCWNKTTALRDLTHQRIGTAISQAILKASQAAVPALLEYMEERLAHRGDLATQQTNLHRRQRELERQRDRLVKSITHQDNPPEFLIQKLEALTAETTQLELDKRLLEEQCAAHVEVPSSDELTRQLTTLASQLSLDDRDTGSLLQRLIDGQIRAIPCQQFGCRQIVLRAEFTLQLVQLLPANVRLHLLKRELLSSEASTVLRRPIVLDLFETSKAPRHAMQALALYQKDPSHPPTLNELAAQLGISKRTAHLALQMGKQLQAAGRTDPFLPLTECPANPARWRFKEAS